MLAAGAFAQPPRYVHERAKQQRAQKRALDSARSLNGHLFIPTRLVGDPFAQSYFRSTTSGGFGVAQGPGFDLTGRLLGRREYTQGMLAQRFELQFAPTAWLALRGSAALRGATGMDAVTILAVRPDVDLTASGGATLSLPAASAFKPALVFDVEHGPPYDVSRLDPALDELASRQFVDASLADPALLDTGTVTTLRPGLSAAFALHRSIGLVLDLRYVGETNATVDLGPGRDGLSFGVALDFDLDALSPVPLGLSAAVRALDRFASGFDPNRELDLGLFYVARPELLFGMSFGVRKFPQARRADTTLWLGAFTIGHDF